MASGVKVAYQGVLTSEEHADVQRLRRNLASGILMLMFGESKALLAEQNTHYAGSVSEDALETVIDGVKARLPWRAVTTFAATASVILLLAGQVCFPVSRSFFAGEDSWHAARAIIENKVTPVPAPRSGVAVQRTVWLWLALLVVIFVAWHFAQIPHAR